MPRDLERPASVDRIDPHAREKKKERRREKKEKGGKRDGDADRDLGAGYLELAVIYAAEARN